MMNKNPVNRVNLVILSLLVFATRLTTLAQVETLVQREMRERRIPGLQLAVVKNGKIIFSKSFGTADVQRAYRMMNGGGKPKEALEIFKLNVFLYPNSANVYDSLAEAYSLNGNRELAIKNYKRSLELDPKNTNAAQQLKKLSP